MYFVAWDLFSKSTTHFEPLQFLGFGAVFSEVIKGLCSDLPLSPKSEENIYGRPADRGGGAHNLRQLGTPSLRFHDRCIHFKFLDLLNPSFYLCGFILW